MNLPFKYIREKKRTKSDPAIIILLLRKGLRAFHVGPKPNRKDGNKTNLEVLSGLALTILKLFNRCTIINHQQGSLARH